MPESIVKFFETVITNELNEAGSKSSEGNLHAKKGLTCVNKKVKLLKFRKLDIKKAFQERLFC